MNDKFRNLRYVPEIAGIRPRRNRCCIRQSLVEPERLRYSIVVLRSREPTGCLQDQQLCQGIVATRALAQRGLHPINSTASYCPALLLRRYAMEKISKITVVDAEKQAQ